MIATHGDQLDRRQVSDEEIKERAAALNYSYFVTSAVDGQNVNEAFRAMGSLILKKSKKDAEGMSEEEEEEIDAFANQLATDLINEHMGDEADDFLNEFEEEENGRFLEEGRNDGVG